MEDNNGHFQRVVDLTEKSIEAWSKVYNKLEEIDRRAEWIAQEIKDLNNMLRQKPCITNTIPYANFESYVHQQCEARENQFKDIKTILGEVKSSDMAMIDKAKEAMDSSKDVSLWLKVLAGIITLGGVILGILLKIL